MVSVAQIETVNQQADIVSAPYVDALNTGLQALVTTYRLSPALLHQFEDNINDLLLRTLCDSNHEITMNQPWGWNPGIESPDLTAGTLTVLQDTDIPIHDHPGSTGLLMVLNGSIRIQSYRMIGLSESREQQPLELELTSEDFLHAGEIGHFGPITNNIHTLHAVDGDCRLFDVLFSPYQLHQRSFFMPIVPANGSRNIFVTRLNKARN